MGQHWRSSTTRRSFIRFLGAAGFVAGAAPGAPAKAGRPLVGSNSFGWTQYAKREKRPFDIAETMSVLRDCGYDYIEPSMTSRGPTASGRSRNK